MKIFTHGCMEKYCQLPRINAAFQSLGHSLTDNMFDADLVYFNNAWYDDVIAKDIYEKINGVIVFNVLDLAPHIADFPIERIRYQLKFADVVTTISETVRKDLRAKTGYDAPVIYQPIQNISYSRGKIYPFKYLFCGRVKDPNKRAYLGLEAVLKNNVSPEKIITAGSEFLGCGAFVGVLKEEVLNDVFNSVDYLIFPSKEEGIGLPIIEAMAAGVIPVICNDLSTREEFLPFKEYDNVEPNVESIARFIYDLEHDRERKADLATKLHMHYSENLAKLFNPISVAEKIIKASKVENNIKISR